MRRAAWLLLIALAADAEPRFVRFTTRTPQGRNTRGLLSDSVDFAFGQSFAGWPTSVGCKTASTITGTKGDAFTFTRSGAALVPSTDGQTYTSCTTNQVRFTACNTTSSDICLFIEGAQRRNQLIYPSDWTQADYVKTNVTCAKTVTGPLGTANSASRCTATAGGGTVKQTGIGGLSGTNLGSVFIRRTTGTGAISVTMDNFVSETAITSSLSSTRWRRVVPADTEGCANGDCIVVPGMKVYTSPASYTLGIKFATNGDAVDVWAGHVENLSGGDVTATSTTVGTPIDVNDGTRATQEAEVAYFTPAASFRPVSVSLAATFHGAATAIPALMEISSGSDFLRLNVSNGGTKNQLTVCSRTTGGVSAVGGGATPMPFSAATLLPLRCEFTSASTVTAFHHNVRDITTGTSAALNTPAAKIQLGSSAVSAGLDTLGMLIKGGCASRSADGCTQSAASPGGSPIAWVGDSITLGTTSAPTRPPNSLESLRTGLTPRAVLNLGIGGWTTTQCLARWREVRGRGFTTLVLLCGVNSALTSSPATAAGAWSELRTILEEARSDGLSVVPLFVLPFGNYVSWGAGPQAYITTINSSMQSWCTANGVTCVDTYTIFSAGGGNPEDLNALYDVGDGLHLNAAGSNLLGSTVSGAIP